MEKKFLPQDLAALLAQQQGISQEEALEFVRAFFSLTEEALIKDSFVKVSGFGTTKLVTVNERESVNISTGERFQIGKHTKISFTPDATLRDLVNRPFALLATTTLYEETPEEELEAVPWLEEDSKEEEEANEMNPGGDSDEIVNTPLVIDHHADSNAGYSEEAEVNIEETATATAEENTTTTIGMEDSPEVATNSLEEEEEIVIIETPQDADVSSASPTNSPTTPQTNDKASQVNVASSPAREQSSQSAAATPPSAAPQVTNIQGELHVKTEEISPKHHRHNTRFNVLLVAFVVLLVVFSYFAGYYHWLCPNCPNNHTSLALATPNAQLATPIIKDSTSQSKDTTKRENKVPSVPQEVPSQEDNAKVTSAPSSSPETSSATVTSPSNSPQIIDEATKAIVKISALTAQEKVNWTKKAQQHQQLPHGKSQIVGTFTTHLVKAGDSLPRLAKHYYGNANYVKYIVLYNHIDNPDLIKVGQRIKLPQLLQQ